MNFKMNRTQKAGIVLMLIGTATYFLIGEAYEWVAGAMCGAGFGLLFFFGPKKAGI